MSVGHVLRYHVVIPLVLFGALVLVGVPFATAFFVGMMAGCLSMMVMMGRGPTAGSSADRNSEGSGTEHRSRS